MNKVLATLIIGAFSAAAFAADPPKADAKDAKGAKWKKLSKQTLPKTAKSKPTAEGTMPELSSSGIFLRLHAKSVAALKWASTHY
ncbi:MAG: hypothetical protein EBR17_08375 [Betaproteobacteria bacterium]|nr:hypothetical protein [Betaproteobacteria bacterium]